MCLQRGRTQGKLTTSFYRLLPAFLLAVISGPPGVSAAREESGLPPSMAFCDTLFPGRQYLTIGLRSRFIVAGSLRLFSNDSLVSDSLYRLEPVSGLIRLDSTLAGSKLVASYRAWSFLTLPDSFRLRNEFPGSSALPPAETDTAQGPSRVSGTAFYAGGIGEGFRLAGFDIKGSKSVSVAGGGAGRSAVFDQNLMLEISGKLSADTRLALRLNDQDLPLMAEGRSAELRELDEISVTLTSPVGSVSLGDYDFSLGNYSFASVERKLDGVSGSLQTGPHRLGASAALSGGTYRSVLFTGQEGRQGPYQLTGKNGEPVRILAGTERVYLNGVMLKRGLRDDYVIDYNQGTLFFTDRHLIGADHRIEVDYEYSSFTFKKALYSVTGETKNSLGTFRGYFLRESDLEDSPLAGTLTPEERDYLSQIGSGLDSLLLPGVRYLGGGRGSYIMHLTDTDKPYFEYVGPGAGDYAVSFREAGPFRGSYILDPSGSGYRFVGQNLGDFEPAGEFTLPGREDRAGIAFQLNPVTHFRLEGEGALLKSTINLFSGASQPVRTAHRLFAYLDTLGLAFIPGRLSLWGGENRVKEGFRFQGRRYEPDFERRWHLAPLPVGSLESGDCGERTREAGTRLALPAGIELGAGYGLLTRTNGERADRRNYSLGFNPRQNISATWQRINIHSERLSPGSTAENALTRAFRRRDNAEALIRLGILTPRLVLEREESTEPGISGELEGQRYLEITQRLAARFSPRFETGLSFLSRDTDWLNASPAFGKLLRWRPYSISRAGQLDFRYQGQGALRLSGRVGHRQRRFENKDLSRTSSTAGRIELFAGSFTGALQSHLVYEVSHGSALRNRVVYLPERYPDEGEYLVDGTYVGKAQGTHRREILPTEVDPRQGATLNLTARENLDLSSLVDSSGSLIKRMTLGTTVQLNRESTIDKSWKLYLLFPSAINDKAQALMKATLINADFTVQWADPAVFTRVELVWNTHFDSRFENGFEEFGDKALRFQFRIPLREDLEWDPTASISRRQRHDLAGGERKVKISELDNRLIASLNTNWRASFNLLAAHYDVPVQEAKYFKLGSGGELTRFIAGNGRIEAGVTLNRIWGTEGEDVLLVDVLGSARSGTSIEATAAVSLEPGERMLLHLRYTGRTDFLLDRFIHYGRAEMKYYF
ncbi:MAG TPA: hypothetical protein VM123_05530 [archaeon]|nr:hypothetical protein [archaeon]